MRRSFIDRLWLPTIVGVTAVLCALVLWQRLLTEQRTKIQAATKAQALFVKNKMESELNARIQLLGRLAPRWQARVQSGDEDQESDAALMMSGYGGYQGIEWVDPTFHVRWVAPETENEADVGADLGADARRGVALQHAEDSGRVMVTRSVDLQGGGRGLVVCVPVFKEKKLVGFLLGVFRYQELFYSTLEDVGQDYWVAVYDGDEEIYGRSGSDPSRAEVWVQETDIEVRQLTWRARVWPTSETLANARSSLPNVAFIGGILMAGLLAFAVYMGEIAHLHAQEVATTNEVLKRETAGREQAEEALRQAQKMEAVGRLAGGVAHDFNNLLMVIRGHAALSLSYFGPDNPLRQELNEILKTAVRASSLTRQLLAFSRKQVLQPRVLDLNSLVTQTAELLPPALGEDINLVLDLDPNLGRVKADAAQMEQVIMNLVFNARDAMPDGGKLTIQTVNNHLDENCARSYPEIRPGPHVMLAVHDSGQGMDEETRLHIFEPFFTTKQRGKGTGLGLATVYGTVIQSGGCVTVLSKLGEGTTIQIYLPRVEEAIEVVEEPKRLSRSLEGEERILVVEDDHAVRRMTREFLKIKGYTVIEASSAEDAIQFVECHEETIDLVLTDVVMPGMKGRELGDRLVKLRSGIKVLYMSAYTEDAAINSGRLGPGSAFIEKPFTVDELAYKVREILGRSTAV
jgi:signal transduction histidine kinase/CheY-like chemotaxis protein